MNKFLSSLLGAFVGTWIAFIVFGIVIFICGIIMLSSSFFSSMQTPAVPISENSILLLNLEGNIAERPYHRSIQEYIDETASQPNNLYDILCAIESAEENPDIAGIYIRCNSAATGTATAKAIRDALQKFKTNSGKWIYAYGDNISQNDYYIASVSDSIFLNPVGILDIHGLTSSTIFYKGMLDKIGVEMQIIRVGTYKSAVEPFMLTSMSEANKLQTQTFINNIWDNITDSIASARDIPQSAINAFADSLASFQKPQIAIETGLIDGLCYKHEMEQKLKDLTGTDEATDLNFIHVQQLSSAKKSDHIGSENEIAVLYASGDINISGSENGINSEDIVPAILDLAEDESIKGLVLRVNSPGGSAYASEQIWEALEQFKKTGKPVAVSMGNYAASGGYYISCGADRIFAEPTTITGSIGIYGMIPSFETLMTERLGLNVEFTTTNQNNDFSLSKPLTPVQRAAFQSHVNRGYELFTSRCAEGRGMTIDQIKQIAEGRVWDATEAKKIGLVDEYGNTTDAITWIAAKAQITNDYSVRTLPEYEEDFMGTLLSALSQSSYEAQLAARFGKFFEYYNEIQNILNQDRLQCRMENIAIE